MLMHIHLNSIEHLVNTIQIIFNTDFSIWLKAKDKIDGIRRPKTGGGPPPAPLTQAEEALYQAMDTRPTIVGLVGGIDTDGTKCSFY